MMNSLCFTLNNLFHSNLQNCQPTLSHYRPFSIPLTPIPYCSFLFVLKQTTNFFSITLEKFKQPHCQAHKTDTHTNTNTHGHTQASHKHTQTHINTLSLFLFKEATTNTCTHTLAHTHTHILSLPLSLFLF